MSLRQKRSGGLLSTRRVSGLVAVLLRVLAMLVTFEMSGASVFAAELVACDDAGEGCCTDCPVEKDGKECPPGCPQCHGSHGSVALAPIFESVSARVIGLDDTALQRPYEAGVHHAPELPGVYRPPRVGPVFS